MNKKRFYLVTMALGLMFAEGCSTPNNSDKPWDRPLQDDNRPGYKSPDAMPNGRDAK